jgi:hypothetical protein
MEFLKGLKVSFKILVFVVNSSVQLRFGLFESICYFSYHLSTLDCYHFYLSQADFLSFSLDFIHWFLRHILNVVFWLSLFTLHFEQRIELLCYLIISVSSTIEIRLQFPTLAEIFRA